MSPFGLPDDGVVAAVCRAGGVGVLDLGRGSRRAREALDRLVRSPTGRFGVRLDAGPHAAVGLIDDVAETGRITTVVLGWGAVSMVPDLSARHRVLVEVTSRDEALHAIALGADGVLARGTEAGGRVGQLGSFVLLQQLLSTEGIRVPVWLCGGIGTSTAAAAVLGGAAGVVLDSQLSLLEECELPFATAAAIRAMDGSETVVVSGQRVLRRRSSPISVDADAEIGELLGAENLSTQLLPIGQDGFLAARFAAKYRTVTGAVRAVRRAILDVVNDGETVATLLPGPTDGSRGSVLGTPLPVAQGPMTRVSDQAGFAAHVAQSGGLPFVALALMTGEETRTLLREVSDSVDQRPWGVGILGFVPEEVKQAQLEVVHEVRPTHAIIAGGRPAQAAALEEVGVSTFLHVPSPTLLGQFLDAGARKFVFEGAECGGHIGPRNSFPLWEAQVQVVLDHLADHPDLLADTISTLFAGGIHDERSAAMVAALARPLTRAGVRVSVLMGTAYLCTAEAVHSGAVQPLFQRLVLEAEHTDLLETAPGHVTRAVRSPFTEHFRSVGDRLRAEGVAERQVWEELEQLNLGRLRVASKGIARDGDALVEVSEDEQFEAGLFMAGQVAVLRTEPTTIRELHDAVTDGAREFFLRRKNELRALVDTSAGDPVDTLRLPTGFDIAIVGMACLFPQASDLETFWANSLVDRYAVTEVPASRWDVGTYHLASRNSEDNTLTTASKWGGFLSPVPFDALRYGIPPTALASIEPVQLLALEVARRALEDAECREGTFDRTRTSVYFGAEAGSDLANAMVMRTMLPSYIGTVPDELDARLPRLTADSFPGMLTNVITGRIANRLDLGGTNCTIDAACASSLAAVDLGCKDLLIGDSDVAVCGGADLHNGIHDYLLFSSVGALSESGISRPFDARADGIVLGEGVACVVLKRLSDAERDCDRVYAVIKGVGSSSDGKSMGLTAPRLEGQRLALERAYRNAGVSPADVGMIEAHGTGTVVGDRTELTALSQMFTDAGAQPASCALGSVKSQIGHTKCAAGLAGLIRTAMSVHTGVIPPTGNLDCPNPAWDPDSSPFRFHTAPRPWGAPPSKRLAGVSAFGFGGTNFHVVLQGYEDGSVLRHSAEVLPAELFTFASDDDTQVRSAVQRLIDLVVANDAADRQWPLRDLAATACANAEARGSPVRIALVATDLDHLAELLPRALAGEHDPEAGLFRANPTRVAELTGGREPTVALLFPGQGSQRPRMLGDLVVAFPPLQRYVSEGKNWLDVLFPPAGFDENAERRHRTAITETTNAQPALGIVELAAHALLTSVGVRPTMLAGHSYGELVALCAAGAFGERHLLELSCARANAIVSSIDGDPGMMAAVIAGESETNRLLDEVGLLDAVTVANQNSPRQTVITGPTEAIGRAVEHLRGQGFSAKTLPVACAFHSRLLGAASERFAEALSGVTVCAPEIPVWANRTASPYPSTADGIRVELAAQVTAPVRFADQVESMYAEGARVFIETGPGSVLSGLVDDTLGDRPHLALPIEPSGRPGVRGFLELLAQLEVAGVMLRTGWLFQGRAASDLTDRTPPSTARWAVDGQLVRTADGTPLAGGLIPARPPLEDTVALQHRNSDGRHGEHDDRQDVVNAFLRNSGEILSMTREMLATQREVLLAYLGAPAATRHTEPASTEVPHTFPSLRPGATQLFGLDPEPAAFKPAVDEPGLDEPAAAGDQTIGIDGTDVARAVGEVIGRRTGYPVEMIEPDLDLEADLSVDSIKRLEIASELVRVVANGSTLDSKELEELSRARTAAAITDWLLTRFNGHGTDVPASETSETLASVEKYPGVHAPTRFVWRATSLEGGPRPDRAELRRAISGARFLLVGDSGPLKDHLARELDEYGAKVSVRDHDQFPGEGDDRVDGLVYLAVSADTEESVLPAAFVPLQAALLRNARWVLAVSPASEGEPPQPAATRTRGLRGLFRNIVQEFPDVVARVVEVDVTEPAEVLAGVLAAELLVADRKPVVQRFGDERYAPVMTETALGTSDFRGTESKPAGTPEARAIGLDADSVILLFGGARGITAQFASVLAGSSGCRLVLVGRTPGPEGPEEPATASAADPAALRAALTRQGKGSVGEIEPTVRRLLAQREITATLDELKNLGSSARYHWLDVRDPRAMSGLIDDVLVEFGRLDGIVYGAGITEDQLVAKTSLGAFERVYDTKVAGAGELLHKLDSLSVDPSFVVFFGSIAAIIGSKGQVGYAAANDALETMGARWALRTGKRALTVHWGPWAPIGPHAGMVSQELYRDFVRRGHGSIDPDEGAMCLLRELAWGDTALTSVLYTTPDWLAYQ